MDEDLTAQLLAFLKVNAVDFQLLTHEPVRTSEDAARIRGTPLRQGAKALVCHVDDRVSLLVVPANRRIDSRAFKRAFGVKNLRMVGVDELQALTGLEVGAVPPFGNLMGLPTYVDERLLELTQISFNAGRRDTSVTMAAQDFVRLVQPTVGRFAADDE